MEGKTYQHLGLKFRISQAPKPAEDGIPYFSSGEWGFIKEKKLTHAEFQAVREARIADMRSTVIPEEVCRKAADLARIYCPGIVAGLRARGAGKGSHA